MAEKEKPVSKRMLYKYPGDHLIDGKYFEYTIVDDDEKTVAAAKKEGWSLDPLKALKAAEAKTKDK